MVRPAPQRTDETDEQFMSRVEELNRQWTSGEAAENFLSGPRGREVGAVENFFDRQTESSETTPFKSVWGGAPVFEAQVSKSPGSGFFSPGGETGSGQGRTDGIVWSGGSRDFDESTGTYRPGFRDSDDRIGIGDFERRQFESTRREEPVRNRSERFIANVDREREPGYRPSMYGDDSRSANPFGQAGASASRLGGRTGGRQQFVGSRPTGTSSTFNTPSSANPNQNWLFTRPVQVASSGLGTGSLVGTNQSRDQSQVANNPLKNRMQYSGGSLRQVEEFMKKEGMTPTRNQKNDPSAGGTKYFKKGFFPGSGEWVNKERRQIQTPGTFTEGYKEYIPGDGNVTLDEYIKHEIQRNPIYLNPAYRPSQEKFEEWFRDSWEGENPGKDYDAEHLMSKSDSDKEFLNRYLDANVGTQVASTDLSGVINDDVKDPLVDSMGRPLNTAAANEVRRQQGGVNRYGQKIITPSTVDLQEKASSDARIFDRYWWEDAPDSKRVQGIAAEEALYKKSQDLYSDIERRSAALETLYGQTSKLHSSLSREYDFQSSRGDDADWGNYESMYSEYTPLSQQYDTEYADLMGLSKEYEGISPVDYGTPEFDEKYGAEGTGAGKWLYENPEGVWYKSGDNYWTNYDTGLGKNASDFSDLGGTSNTQSGEQYIAQGKYPSAADQKTLREGFNTNPTIKEQQRILKQYGLFFPIPQA